jgi:hypothetical protein
MNHQSRKRRANDARVRGEASNGLAIGWTFSHLLSRRGALPNRTRMAFEALSKERQTDAWRRRNGEWIPLKR